MSGLDCSELGIFLQCQSCGGVSFFSAEKVDNAEPGTVLECDDCGAVIGQVD